MDDAHCERFLVTIEAAAVAEPAAQDQDRRRWTDRDTQAFDRMRDARAALATELGLDAGVLCPSKLLKDAVRTDPTDARDLCDSAGLRPWQRELLADLLWDAYRGTRASRSRSRSRTEEGSGSEAAVDQASDTTSSSTAPTS